LHFQPLLSGDEQVGQRLTDTVRQIMDSTGEGLVVPDASREVSIPICYGGAFGPDLADVAAHCKLSPDEVIHLHCQEPAYVFMLGFAPGAPYIGVHDPRLAIGRRDTPRTRVPAGSVA